MDLNKLKKLIDEVSVVSFDIFDTLLLRTYAKPVDLFYHLEKLYKVDNFALNRIEAEKKARLNKEEVTIDEIYSEIPQYSFMLEKEIELEAKNLHQNKEMFDIYQYALKEGKKVIITSDMYLPFNVIEDVLIKNGYSDFYKLYLSNVYNKTKFSGKLFDLILEELNIKQKDILHIGDNYNIDYLSAKNKGMNAFYYKSVISRYLKKHNNLVEFYNKNKSYELSILMMLSAENEIFSKDYWYNIGFTYGGIIALGYIDFIKAKLKENDIEDLIFVARDGYTLKRVFDNQNLNVNSYYVYASRGLCNPELNSEVHNYLNNYNFSSKTAMVESISGSYTAQKLIESHLDKKLLGFYINLVEDAWKKFPDEKACVYSDRWGEFFFINWDFVEFLFSAPESPICGLKNGKPVYKKVAHSSESYRKKIYPGISDGIYDFYATVKKYFNEDEFKVLLPEIIDWHNYFYLHPNGTDKKYFKKIYHAFDKEHKNYQRLFKDWYGIKRIRKKILETIFSLKNSNGRKVITILGIKIKIKRKKS